MPKNSTVSVRTGILSPCEKTPRKHDVNLVISVSLKQNFSWNVFSCFSQVWQTGVSLSCCYSCVFLTVKIARISDKVGCCTKL